MKIAILSMQKVVNSGSFLQAYGLQHVIENLGHTVIWKDYKKKNINVSKTRKHKDEQKNYISKAEMALKCIFNTAYRNRVRAGRVMKDFYVRYPQWLTESNIIDATSVNDAFDCLVIGSDEVFNLCQFIESSYPIEIPWELLGKGFENHKIISYAASAGQTNISKLRNYEMLDMYKECLAKFYSISVRDSNTKNIMNELGFESNLHIDPVLLYDFHDVELCRKVKEPYILVYAYEFRITTDEAIEIKKYARKYNKRLICVNFMQDFCDEMIVISPLEMLSYFKYADYVITDTFHGAVLSMKYNSQFAVYIRKSNENKLRDLLESFNLTDRIIENGLTLENILNCKWNYDEFNEELLKKQYEALDYLKRGLQS